MRTGLAEDPAFRDMKAAWGQQPWQQGWELIADSVAAAGARLSKSSSEVSGKALPFSSR